MSTFTLTVDSVTGEYVSSRDVTHDELAALYESLAWRLGWVDAVLAEQREHSVAAGA